jgi:hypothetical protein
VQAAASFCHPWLVEDMTTVLLAARAEPVRVRRGDERPFSRFVEETAERLLSFPAWLEGFTGMGLEARVGLALRGLRIAGLLGPDAGARGSPALRPRTGWREWVEAPLGERLRLLVAALSPAGGVLDGVFDLLDEDQGPGEEETPAGMIRTVLQAFTSVPAASYIRFSDFVDYQAAIGAPSGAVGHGDGEPPAGGSSRGPRARGGLSPDPGTAELPVVSTDEALEDLWKFVLHRVFSRALLALGGAEAGVTENGEPCFRITDTGRRLLARSPLPQAEQRHPAQIVVQPTFEVVFLSPSPAAEAILARFCERRGREVGLLFRLTRHSVARAASSGMGSGEVLGSLARFSRSPIPANVEHEVRGWIEAGHGNGGQEGGEA